MELQTQILFRQNPKSFELLKYIKGKKALLFSPGGSSLEFKNYVERGRYFELMVKNHE